MITIGNRGYLLSLARLVPGREEAASFSRMVDEGLPTYKVFGYWDVATFAQLTSLSEIPSTAAQAYDYRLPRGAVSRATQEVCYTFADLDDSGPVRAFPHLGQWPQDRCLGVCLAKLTDEVLRARGVAAIADLRDAVLGLSTGLRSPNVLIGGSLSWADAVILFFANDFPTILTDIARVVSYASAEHASLLKTVTLPCYRYHDSIDQNPDPDDDFFAAEGLGRIVADVSCSFRSGSPEKMLAIARHYFGGVPAFVLGQNDVVVRSDLRGPELVARLLQMRREDARELIGTATYLLGTDIDLCQDMPKGDGASAAPEDFDVGWPDSEVVDGLRVQDEALARNIETLYECASFYVSDPISRSGFDDLVLPLKAFAQHLDANRCQLDNTELLSHWWGGYKDLSIALRQRASAVQRIFDGTYQPPSTAVSASWKITRAATALVQDLLEGLGQPWEGCIVVDWDADFSQSGSGIISIPHGQIVVPSGWWGLGHETGHEHLRQHLAELWASDLESYGVETSMEELIDRASTGAPCWQITPAWFWEEIYAELFDFIVTMGADWDYYLGTAWTYVQKAVYRHQIPEFVFRSVLVKAVHLAMQGELPWNASELRNRETEAIWNGFTSGVSGCSSEPFREWIEDPLHRRDARIVLSAWWPVASITAQAVMNNVTGCLQERLKRADETADAWLRGEVVPDPHGAFAAVKSLRAAYLGAAEERVRTEVAVIMSLWHLGVTCHSGYGAVS